MTKKVTKRENYEALRECVLEHADWFPEGECDRLIEFIDHEVEQLDKRAANAKKYAQKSKDKADELTDILDEVLQGMEGPATIAEIVTAALEQHADCGVTQNKAAYRLNKLVETGRAVKDVTTIKEEGKASRKVNTYQLA